MNDETYTYVETQRERKKLKNSARYRKCGSKSKRCSLPHERLTAKQLRERNGEIMSYNLGGRMPYDDFKKMPDDLKREYITKLVTEYEARSMDIAEMFGVKRNTFCTITRKLGMDLSRPSNTKISQKWIDFVKATNDSSDDPEIEEISAPVSEPETTHETTLEPKRTHEEVKLTNGQLCFTGNPEAIFAKIMQVLNPTAKYSISVALVENI